MRKKKRLFNQSLDRRKKRMPLDPQLTAILKESAAQGLPPYTDLSPEAARKQMLELALPVDPALSVNKTEDRRIPGPGGAIPIRLYYPEGDPPFPVLVYFHGGGWVIGSIESHDALCHAISKTSDCLVVSVDYRLAPEHPYPAAPEDSYAATCWVAQNAEMIQADAGRIAVGGDSAGGNLAAVVAMMARDRQGPDIGRQVLMYPITGDDLNTPSYLQNAEGYVLTRDLMIWFWNYYLAAEKRFGQPYAAPLRADNLKDLPDALILTAEYDPLRDEGEAYAKRLKEAGVDVMLKRYDGMIHGFIKYAARLDKAKEALEAVAAFLKRDTG